MPVPLIQVHQLILSQALTAPRQAYRLQHGRILRLIELREGFAHRACFPAGGNRVLIETFICRSNENCGRQVQGGRHRRKRGGQPRDRLVRTTSMGGEVRLPASASVVRMKIQVDGGVRDTAALPGEAGRGEGIVQQVLRSRSRSTHEDVEGEPQASGPQLGRHQADRLDRFAQGRPALITAFRS